ncbi:MAG: hypothetical protein ACFE0Q_21135, partial [Anaerolineae bacterium]
MIDKIFTDYKRVDLSPKTEAKSYYKYLDSSARPAFKSLRELITKWYLSFDADSEKKNELKSEFCSTDDRKHFSAFFELYLYTLFNNLGYKVTVEPTMPNGTRPDFLLTDSDGSQMLLEATAVYPDELFGGAKMREKRMKDEINTRIRNRDFWLNLHLIDPPNDNPPIAKICR